MRQFVTNPSALAAAVAMAQQTGTAAPQQITITLAGSRDRALIDNLIARGFGPDGPRAILGLLRASAA
jgi:hypothetical protein